MVTLKQNGPGMAPEGPAQGPFPRSRIPVAFRWTRRGLGGLALGLLAACSGEASSGVDEARPESGAAASGATMNDGLVRVAGRTDRKTAHFSGDRGLRLGWTMAGFRLRFQGTSLKVPMVGEGGPIYIRIVIDGRDGESTKVLVGNSPSMVTLASAIPRGSHTVEVFRITEASFGPLEVDMAHLDADGPLEPLAPATRRVEILGDSYTAGQGILGCPKDPSTQDGFLSYGALAARRFGAESTILGWSGIGLYRDWQGHTQGQFPSLYPRAVPTDSGSLWATGTPVDAIVANVGGNDWSMGDPGPAFEATYEGFIRTLRRQQPKATIFVGWFTGRPYEKTMEKLARRLRDGGDSNVVPLPLSFRDGDLDGCAGHAGLGGHRNLALQLEKAFKSNLGW